jgi:hypothetical protein
MSKVKHYYIEINYTYDTITHYVTLCMKKSITFIGGQHG